MHGTPLPALGQTKPVSFTRESQYRSGGAALRRQARHVVRAGPSTSEKAQEEEEQVSFKYNAAMQRWEKKKGGYKDGRKGNVESLITPLAGAAYTVWPVIHEELTQAGLESISAAEAYRLQQEKGALLVDCRVDWNFEKEHAEGAESLPLFRGVTGNDLYATLKRIAMGSFAMKATERDPDYQQTARERLDKSRQIIMMCSIGGTIKTGTQPWGDPNNPSRKAQKKFDDPERAFGRESRSLKACHELIKAGFKNVTHLEGGLNQWRHDGYPTVRSDGKVYRQERKRKSSK